MGFRVEISGFGFSGLGLRVYGEEFWLDRGDSQIRSTLFEDPGARTLSN